MSYSIDFRKHVFKIKERDSLTFRQTGEHFGISPRTLFKWKKRMESRLHRNKPATKIDMEALQKHVEDCPDSYQYERAAHFGASPSCILYTLHRLDISNKKTLFHPKADAAKRAEFAAKPYQYEQEEHRPIIYMDKSGFCVYAPRDRGYSFRGKRCYGSRDWHRKGRVNAIGAVHHFKTVNICLLEGNINADVFYAWTTQQLIPSIPKKSVVEIDNATFHKRTDTLNAIRAKGYDVLFLPPYIPDLNPIEKKWAQAKNVRKKHRCNPYQLFETCLL